MRRRRRPDERVVVGVIKNRRRERRVAQARPWGRRPGLGGTSSSRRGGGSARLPLFFQGPGARRAVLPRFWGPWWPRAAVERGARARRGFSAICVRRQLDFRWLRGARPRNSLWVLRTPQATAPTSPCLARGRGWVSAAKLQLGRARGYIFLLIIKPRPVLARPFPTPTARLGVQDVAAPQHPQAPPKAPSSKH